MKKVSVFAFQCSKLKSIKKIPGTNVWVATVLEPSYNGCYDLCKEADTSLFRLLKKVKRDYI